LDQGALTTGSLGKIVASTIAVPHNDLAPALPGLSRPGAEKVPEHFLKFNSMVLPNSRL
jgi:hypothetical protein